jgi:peptidoglycan hydrolase-like protein with peptidoglycan-binding domain
MPVNPTIRSLAQDGRISLGDAQKLKEAVSAGTVSRAEASDATSRYAEAMDQDAHALLGDSFQSNGRARLSSLPDSLLGQTLQKGMRSEGVSMLQRGLMAAGLSSQNASVALPSGADGIFGGETEKSVRAFQRSSGLPESGKADPATLRALNQALAGSQHPTPSRPTTQTPAATTLPAATTVRPSTGLRRPETAPTTPTTAPTTAAPTTASTTTTSPPAKPSTTPVARAAPTVGSTLPEGVAPGTPEAVAAASRDLATGARAAHYGTVNPWKNIDPNHAVPVDVRMGGLANRWKCNLFGGNALAAAGFEPPYYGKSGKGEYPVAEQWQRWATPSAEHRARATAAGETVVDHARAARNQSRFDLMDEVRPTSIQDPAARLKRVEELLARVQPGDVVTADHAGAAGSDGGHVRVCVGRDDTGRPLFAQAKQQSAEVVAEGATDANWLNEDAIYILRPNTPRVQAP